MKNNNPYRKMNIQYPRNMNIQYIEETQDDDRLQVKVPGK